MLSKVIIWTSQTSILTYYYLDIRTSHTNAECPSNIDPQIQVTDGIQGLKAGVGYHRRALVFCSFQDPKVQALGLYEDKGKAGCIGSLLVV